MLLKKTATADEVLSKDNVLYCLRAFASCPAWCSRTININIMISTFFNFHVKSRGRKEAQKRRTARLFACVFYRNRSCRKFSFSPASALQVFENTNT